MIRDLKNASVFITGANGGIGLETVKLLSEAGTRTITLACRTEEKARLAIEKVGSTRSQLIPAGGFDMNKASKIEAGVRSLASQKPFDIVFFQSGGIVVSDDYQFTPGLSSPVERTIYQNVFGAYVTLVALEKQGLVSENARVVFAGGEGARGIKGLIEKPTFNSAAELRAYIHNGGGKYNEMNAIGVSKFISALLVQELAHRDSGREYVWFSPGLTGGTKGLINVPQPKRFVMEKIGFPLMQAIGFAQGPKAAAAKYVASLIGEYGESGDVIGAPEGKALGNLVDQKPMNPGLTNLQFRELIWEIITAECGQLQPLTQAS